jgi:hypothetical protein
MVNLDQSDMSSSLGEKDSLTTKLFSPQSLAKKCSYRYVLALIENSPCPVKKTRLWRGFFTQAKKFRLDETS